MHEVPAMPLEVVRVDHWTQVRAKLWEWSPFFTPEEMADSKSGALTYRPAFMNWLVGIRYLFDAPMVIASGYRTPAHQALLTKDRTTGSHVDAEAVDIRISGQAAWDLHQIATANGVMGLGVHQSGDFATRYLHLDRWTQAPDGVRPRLWDY